MTDDDVVAGLRYIEARKRSKAGVFPYLRASLRKIGLIGSQRSAFVTRYTFRDCEEQSSRHRTD